MVWGFQQDVWANHLRGTECIGNAVHAVRTQCKVLYVGKNLSPSFGPLGEHLTRHTRGVCAVPRTMRRVANLALNTKPGEVQQDANL